MKTYKWFIVTYTLQYVFIASTYGQISTKELPVSFGLQNMSQKSDLPIANKVLPALDMTLINQEDEKDEANGLPPRFGYPHPVNYNLNNSGEWTTLSNGDKIWRLHIECPDALSINLLYNEFWLPEGAKLFVYSQNKTKSIGAFTAANNKGTETAVGGFATGLIYSDQITLEYYVPNGAEQGIISVAYVVQGYRYINLSTEDFGNSGSCQVNVNCPEGQNWQNEKNAVALILVNGNRWCSGSLINNTANDNSPLFLTANHCLSGVDAVTNPNAYYYSFYWNYEHPTCANSSIEPSTEKSTTGAEVVANNSVSDFALLRLTRDPKIRSDINLYYLGWDRSGNAGTSGVGIHHPQGDVKKISAYNQIQNHSTEIHWSGGAVSLANTHWDVTFYNGLIQGGSSGSPLLNSSHRVIGQLHGGYDAFCNNQSYAKYYGKFNVSWTGNGATDSRRKLQPWLDPTNSNVSVLNGIGVNTRPDLMIADSPEDVGNEPNLQTGEIIWNSPNIWVRNQNDDGLVHENPVYAENPCYVYVRVKNIGKEASSGTEQLHLYWAKAATALSWPDHWTGNSYFENGSLKGNLIHTLTIPSIPSGEERILSFEWSVPNPSAYSDINPEPWHFCLLARIEAANDPMSFPETDNLGDNTRNNNNISWKNVSIIELKSGKISAAVAVRNPERKATLSYNLLVKNPASILGRYLYQEADIIVRLDEVLAHAWAAGGGNGDDILILDPRTVLIKGPHACLKNLILRPGETGTLSLRVHFLAGEMPVEDLYTCHLIQENAETGEVIGGEVYEICQSVRDPFYADAGDDVTVDAGQAIVLSAAPIGEPATYNWYNQSGELIYEGADFATSTAITQKYKLEVIALADGYKGYDEVTVNLKPNKIETVYPNPVSDLITVEYKLNEAENAYLSIVNYYYSNIANNYILDVSTSSRTIDISAYPTGIYTVSLICDGVISDSKVFIKQ